MTYRLFISSVQSEFSRERRMLCDYVMGDALLGHFFRPFLFEDLPALNDSAQKAYLTEAAASDVYLGIYGERHGYEDAEGVSPTEREYDTAKANGRYRIVFIKDAELRHEKESAFIAKVEQDVVRRSFSDENSLRTAPAKLLTHHASKPTNPTLAEPVYLAGYIERLGTGTEDMVSSCLAAGLPQPEFRQDEDFCVTIWRKNALSSGENAPSLGENAPSLQQNAPSCINIDEIRINGRKLTKKQRSVLEFCKDVPRTSNEIAAYVGVALYSRTRNTYISNLVSVGLLRPIVIGKTTSPNQKYVTTAGVV